MANDAALQPELGQNAPPVKMKSEAQAVKDEKADLATIAAFLDKLHADVSACQEALTSDHLQVCSVRAWLGYLRSEINVRKDALK